MSKTKEITTSIQTMDEADAIMKEIALLKHKKAKVEMWVTAEEQKIRDRAKKDLAINAKETVDDRIAGLGGNLLSYIRINKDLFSGEKRSKELVHGELGFRLGKRRVDVIGKITVKAILATSALFKLLDAWGWIKGKPSLDKEQILVDHQNEPAKTNTKLHKVSMAVKQDDEPWFEERQVELNTSREAA